jgi:hypothetical protein
MPSSGIELARFRLVAQHLKLRYRVPPLIKSTLLLLIKVILQLEKIPNPKQRDLEMILRYCHAYDYERALDQ